MILFFYLSPLRVLFLAKTLQDHQKFHDVRCPKVSDFFDFFEFVLNLLFIEGVEAPEC